MAFSDPRYVFFLATVVIVAMLLPAGRSRLVVLVAAGLVFAAGLGVTAIVMPVVGFTAFLGGLALGRQRDGLGRTGMFIAVLALTLSPLLFFKYWGVLPGTSSILLPVGISFYTFMVVGYLIDAFIDPDNVQTNPLNFAAFIWFFPHLTAGPIARAPAFFQQLPKVGTFNHDMVVSGLRSILVGMFMKVVSPIPWRPLWIEYMQSRAHMAARIRL